MSTVLAGKRILIVEDEFMIAILLEDMLTELNCSIAGISANLTQALELIGSTEIDAAVLDVNLDGHDSFAVAAALVKRRIPFIFATGYGASRLPQELLGHTVVQKPYRLEELSMAFSQLPLL
jgi:CheY-like chemotaxis protein